MTDNTAMLLLNQLQAIAIEMRQIRQLLEKHQKASEPKS